MPRFNIAAVQISSPSLRTISSGGGPREEPSEEAAVASILGLGARIDHRSAPGLGSAKGVYMLRVFVPIGAGGLGDCDVGFWDVYLAEIL
jgi:hypothetical protein